MVGQNKLLASHKNGMKNNVAKFIKDHNLGTRHFRNQKEQGNSHHTTAMDTLGDPMTNMGSDNASWLNSRAGGISNKGKNNIAHPKSQMLNLSFKKVLDT